MGKYKYELLLIIVLTVICVVSGGILGLVNAWTEPVIQAQKELAKEKALREVLPLATAFRAEEAELDKFTQSGFTGLVEIYRGLRVGQPEGFVFIVEQQGYASLIRMVIGITQAGNLAGVKVTSQSESPGLGAKITNAEFLTQQAFQEATSGSQLAVTQDRGEVEAITNATISSRAVVRGVNAALAASHSLLVAENQIGGAFSD
jgi:electron transport complex protein RnfG